MTSRKIKETVGGDDNSSIRDELPYHEFEREHSVLRFFSVNNPGREEDIAFFMLILIFQHHRRWSLSRDKQYLEGSYEWRKCSEKML